MIKFIKKLFCRHELLEELRTTQGLMVDVRISKCEKCSKQFTSWVSSDFGKKFKENIKLARDMDKKLYD